MDPKKDKPVNIIQRLPRELQLCVFDWLDYEDAIKLSQVSRYFRNTISPEAWPKANKERFIYDVQFNQRHNMVYFDKRCIESNEEVLKIVSDGYACFSCFKVLDRSLFSFNQTKGRFAKGSRRYEHFGHSRFCIACGIQKGLYKSGKLISPVVFEERRGNMFPGQVGMKRRLLVICTACKELCEYEISKVPHVCRECEEIYENAGATNEDIAALEHRSRGLLKVQCNGCGLAFDIRAEKGWEYCSNCDGPMCNRCCTSSDEVSTEDCSCSALTEADAAEYTAAKPRKTAMLDEGNMFKEDAKASRRHAMRATKTDGDLMVREESDLLRLLNLDHKSQ